MPDHVLDSFVDEGPTGGLPSLVPSAVKAKGDTLVTTVEDRADAMSALAKLRDEQNGVTPEAKPAEAKPAEAKPAEAKPAEAKPAEAKPAEAPLGEVKPAEAPLGEVKPADAKPAEAKPAEAKPATDELDSVQLPPHTSPRASESFNKIKQLAREERERMQASLKSVEETRQQLEAKVKELEAKTGRLPDNVEQEIAELRRFKLANDIKSDPEFTKHDAAIASNNEAIMAKLKQAGVDDAALASIKELGGPDKVDWEPLLPTLPTALRRYVEAKLVENVQLSDQRDAALKHATENASEYVRTAKEREVKRLTELANQNLKMLPWTATKEIPANATPETKAAIERDNAFAKEQLGVLETFLANQSPESYAELAVIAVQAAKLKADRDAAQSREAALKAAVTSITAERDKALKELDDIKRAATPHILPGSGEVRSGDALKGESDDILQDGPVALARLRKEYEAAIQRG